MTNNYDREMFKWLKIFNKYDLYTKSNEIINKDEIKEYYDSLLKKYFVNDYLLI